MCRELLYATVGQGPDVFWLQARIHGNELHSTEAVLQVLKYLAASGDPVAKRIREQLTVMVIPMYNPDGAEANIRQSTTPLQIDLNRDWELFRQPESRAWYALWEQTHPRLALDLHHMGQSPVVEGTNQLNTFQIGARSIDPSRMTEEQWLTNRQMALLSVDAVQRLGPGNVTRYPLIDITNAVISRMLLGGPGPDGSDPHFRTQGAIFYEVRSVGQKSNGMLELLFVRPTMAVLAAAADGSLYAHPGTGWEDIPFGDGEPCGGGLPTRNVIAETPGGDPNRVVVVGAHLDSVPAGPGINDNGSGSGTILEIAEVYAAQNREPRNKLRFIWFGAEELGLLGSAHYVESLSKEARQDIIGMLNFDMLGSPNFVRFVYDGDGSAGLPGGAGPAGSDYIEGVFLEYFAAVGLVTDPTAFDGRSDYGPFIAEGVDIPAGGLFSGAEAPKTQAQVDRYGGLLDAQLDPCYHAACDTFAGTGDGAGATSPGRGLISLDQLSDAAAHAVLTLSKTKSL